MAFRRRGPATTSYVRVPRGKVHFAQRDGVAEFLGAIFGRSLPTSLYEGTMAEACDRSMRFQRVA